MPTHKDLEIQLMNMRNFTPRANKNIKILVKKKLLELLIAMLLMNLLVLLNFGLDIIQN